jgi:adenylate cyclase
MARRLAAILAADVVGYSKLMAEDEAGTLAALKTHRAELFDPETTKRGGRIVKLMGDGALVEFPSVVDAVKCALAIQRALAGDNDKIKLRIGVNLGDVIIDGEDIYGDGVNVAARLEALAEPGGIAISGIVHEGLGNRVEADFIDAGEQQVKNIARPIRLFRWSPVQLSKPKTQDQKTSGRPSIAVLPFTNMSSDEEQEYFSDGITEDIITELARFNSLFVIARNSSFQYKGQSPKIQDVGSALGVQYVVEGSVRKSGNRVRITAQLVEAATGNHVWAERYDRDLEEIFAVQDEVVREIVTAVPGALDAAAIQRAKPTDNTTAYELLLRAWQVRNRDWGSHEARDLYEKVIAADPQCALAYAHLANWHAYSVMAHGAPRHEAERRMMTYADKALQLNANDPIILSVIADGYVVSGNLDLAKTSMEKAVKLNPNSYLVMSFASVVFLALGDIDAALHWIDLFRRHDPISIDAHREVTLETYYMAGRFEDAGNILRGWQTPPKHIIAEAAAAFAQAGNLAEAAKLRKQYLALSPSPDAFAEYLATQLKCYALQKHRDLWLEGFRKAGFEC